MTIRKRLSRFFHEGVFVTVCGAMILVFLILDVTHGSRSGVISDLILMGLFALTLTLRHLSRRHEMRRAEKMDALRDRIKSEVGF